MAANSRSGAVGRASMRPPPPRGTHAASQRGAAYSSRFAASTSTAASIRQERLRAPSPAESVSSVATSHAGTKRKERDYEAVAGASGGGTGNPMEETNINVVVRCRGRNEREVRENSAVVLSTDGVKGSAVELSMGPNALSDKTYTFDRVFSQAADQAMIFDDVVKPILGEVSLLAPAPVRRPLVGLLTRTTLIDARRVQLYHLRVRANRHGKDLHHVRRPYEHDGTTIRRGWYHP